MRVRHALVLAALTAAFAPSGASASGGATMEITGVPATLTIPGNGFTLEVKGNTGTGVEDQLVGYYGPNVCQATLEATNGFEELAVPLDASEVPLFYFTGAFSIKAELVGKALGERTEPGPGVYHVCMFLRPFKGTETLATASATFTAVEATPTPPPTPGAPPPVAPLLTKHCLVHSLKGKTLVAATKALRQSGCAVGKVSHVASKRVKKGRVMSQGRKPGAVLPAGSKIQLVVSKG